MPRRRLIQITPMLTQAEKNRAAAAANNLQKGSSGPMRLYVGSLHFNITEEMLRGIFEPFGKVGLRFHSHRSQIDSPSVLIRSVFALKIEGIQLMMDSETGRSKGYGFISVNKSFRSTKCFATSSVRLLTFFFFFVF